MRSTIAGLYDQNRFDGNPVVGPAAGHADNRYLACGFSGHGPMHALGAGRAVAEYVVHGRFTTIDLTRLGPARLATGEPMAERGIR